MATPETIKKTVNTNVAHYVNHIQLNPIDKPQISVVMATHDRIEQTLFTLKTINDSSIKTIQVIIIDDSNNHMSSEQLSAFPYQIDYLTVKDTRDWINPCVNYNIAFSFIKAEKVVIQNAEVCHVGDVLAYVNNRCSPNRYLVFDVAACKIPKDNRRLHNMSPYNLTTVLDTVTRRKFTWYQHHNDNKRNYHFLTSIHKQDLDRLGGFDYDFALDRCADDNEFIYRITHVLKLNIEYPPNLMGIHQWHDRVTLGCTPEEYKASSQRNVALYRRKVSKYKAIAKSNV